MTKRLRRSARLMPEDSALRVPYVKACDVEVYATVLGAQLHHHLGLRHGLAAAVAGLSVARAAPNTRGVLMGKTSIGELLLNQETKDVRVHGEPRGKYAAGVPGAAIGPWSHDSGLKKESGWKLAAIYAHISTRRRREKLAEYAAFANRHTWASRLTMAGVDPRIMMALGGWSNMGMLARYSHLTPGHLQAAVEKLVPMLVTAAELAQS